MSRKRFSVEQIINRLKEATGRNRALERRPTGKLSPVELIRPE